MKKMGIEMYYNSRFQGLSRENNKAVVTISNDEGKKTELSADKLLVAVGFRPNSENLGLENARIELSKSGFIKVNEKRQTTEPKIYAVGDAAGPPFLAHKAFREGKVAAEALAGMPSAFDNRAVPEAVLSDPEIAIVGMDEESARKSGFEIRPESSHFALPGVRSPLTGQTGS